MNSDDPEASDVTKPDIFEKVGQTKMPAPGFRQPPCAVEMPEASPGFNWELAAWRVLLMLLIALIWVAYLTCGLLRAAHEWMVRARASLENRIGKMDGSIPEEIV
jgi:hypothetical protein